MNDPHSRAMSDGKARVQASVVWELRAGALHLRCLPTNLGGTEDFVVQARDSKGWSQIANGPDPAQLFRKVAMLPATARAIKGGT